jgi:hypothetical protein
MLFYVNIANAGINSTHNAWQFPNFKLWNLVSSTYLVSLIQHFTIIFNIFNLQQCTTKIDYFNGRAKV